VAAALTEAKPRAIYGPEPWQHDGEAAWSHRDLWFCLVARRDHDGNLAVLADTIEGQHERSGRDDAEAKISHLDDLVDRLAAARLDAEALAARADDHAPLRTTARTNAQLRFVAKAGSVEANSCAKRHGALKAEGEGFEPSKDLTALNGFRDREVKAGFSAPGLGCRGTSDD